MPVDLLDWFFIRPVRALPLLIDILLLVWTAITAPITGGQEDWAVIPAILTLPAVVLVHIWLFATDKHQAAVFLYSAVHIVLFFPFWWWCVLTISKGE